MISNIDLCRIFRKVPNVSEDEAKHAADTVARVDQVATKADIRELRVANKADLIALEARLAARMEAKIFKLALWTVAFNVTFTVTLTVGLIKLL